MKKFLMIITLVLLLLSLSSCDDAKYFEIIAMPRDVEYATMTGTSYTAKGEVLLFEDLIKNSLKEDKKFTIDFKLEESICNNDKVFIVVRYSNNLITGVYGFAIWYFDGLTQNYDIISYFETLNRDITFKKVGDYVVLGYEYALEVFDSRNATLVNRITCDEEWQYNIGNYSFGYMTKNGFTVYDENLVEYHHKTEIIMSDYEPYEHIFGFYRHIIYYYDANDEYQYYDVKNKKYISKEEYYAYTDSFSSYDDKLQYEIHNDKANDDLIKLTYNENEYEYKIEDFRNRKEIIRQVEALCETEVYFYSAFLHNEDVFVIVGNQDSFFGLYTPGRTLPLVFRVDLANDQIDYVGAIGAIYYTILRIYELN